MNDFFVFCIFFLIQIYKRVNLILLVLKDFDYILLTILDCEFVYFCAFIYDLYILLIFVVYIFKFDKLIKQIHLDLFCET